MTYTLEIELIEDAMFGDSWDAIDYQDEYEEDDYQEDEEEYED